MHQVIKRISLNVLNELSIKVNIADRYYPLKVTSEQEPAVREAARIINEKLKLVQQQFDVKDKQDVLGMTLLEFATRLVELERDQAGQAKELGSELLGLQSLLKDVSI